jgi:tetratricopeptide (TPR) repeat protein
VICRVEKEILLIEDHSGGIGHGNKRSSENSSCSDEALLMIGGIEQMILRKFSQAVSGLIQRVAHFANRVATPRNTEKHEQEPWQARLKSLAENLLAVRNVIINFSIIALLFFFLWILIPAVKTISIVVHPIPVPEVLAKRSYSREVFTTRVAAEMARIDREAETVMPRKSIDGVEVKPDILVPVPGQTISFRTIVLFIKEELPQFKDIVVSIDVTADKRNYIAQIRIVGGPYNGSVGKATSSISHSIEDFVDLVAESAMRATAPYVLTSYKLSVAESLSQEALPLELGNCLADYDEILKKPHHTDDKWALLGKSYVLSRLDNNKEAIECCRRAIKIDQKFYHAYFNWGAALDSQGKYREAIEQYEKAVDFNSKFADAHFNWGAALDSQGKYREAIEQYEKAVDIDSRYAEAYFNWGVALDNLGKYREAIEQYEKAVDINPKDAEAYFNWGVALDNLGKYREAIEQYEKAVDIDSRYADAHFNWGIALDNLEKYQEAIEQYKKAATINSRYAEAYFNWGIALEHLGKSRKAIEQYNKAVNINPKYAQAYRNMGRLLKLSGRQSEADEKYDLARKAALK